MCHTRSMLSTLYFSRQRGRQVYTKLDGVVWCAGAAAEMDAKAIETLQEAYGPDYKVVGVRSREVLLNAGNIHCITQQWVKAG